ncbi:MFS transporter [Streptomyces sedi]|uniref:MFS transporter n=1 Tax=Streptomyces sedi TaxID=555059 RepID=A0A5C4VCV7_9ACTN|nr:MFS transporter [Streptomyces sedi]
MTRFTPREGFLLAALCGAIFLEGSGIALLTIALPRIREDFGASTGELSAIASAYVIAYGGFMLLGGRVADVFGRRRVFLAGLIAFAVFCVLGAAAHEVWLLLAARFVAGAASGFMTPAGMSLITGTFEEGPRRDRALVFYGAATAAGFALGAALGGLLTAVHWRWVLFLPALLAVVILALSVATIPRDGKPGPRAALDLFGALKATAAAVLLVTAITRLEDPAEGTTTTGLLFVSGLALLALFLVRQRSASAPLVPPRLLRAPGVLRADAAVLLFAAGFYAFQFLLTLYLQELLGWTPVQTGLAFVLMSLEVVIAPLLTPRLLGRFGTRSVTVLGLLAGVAASAWFLPAGTEWGMGWIAPPLVLVSLAFAFAYGPLAISSTSGVDDQGAASGLFNAAVQFGAAIGLAAAAAVYSIALGADSGTAAGLDAFRIGVWVPVVAFAAASALGLTGRRSSPSPQATDTEG